MIDFGIARHFKLGQLRDTIPFGSVVGYAAPEEYGRVQTSPRADIYSLGATLHQMSYPGHSAWVKVTYGRLMVHALPPADMTPWCKSGMPDDLVKNG